MRHYLDPINNYIFLRIFDDQNQKSIPKSIEIAKKLLKTLSIQDVSEVTEIPVDQLRQLDV